MLDVEGNTDMVNVMKMQKLDAATVEVNIVLLLEDALFEDKLKRHRRTK